MVGIFDKALSKKVTRKEFLKYGSLLALGGFFGGFLRIFGSKKEDDNSYGNNSYGGVSK